MSGFVERIPVAFAGEGSGTGPLSWGQQSILKEMAGADNSLAMTSVAPLEPGTALETFVEQYRFFLSRYESMRTLLSVAPDGAVSQVVRDSGTAQLEVYEAAGRDPAAVADEVGKHYFDTRFDYEREWPMRMALVRHDGAFTHQILTVSHHVADATAAMAMFDDLCNRDPATGEPPRPPGLQPLAQARLQAQPSARRQNEAALRYWQTQLRTMPLPRLPVPAGPDHRHWEVNWLSPRLHPALRAAAARLGVTTTPVLYAAFVHALAGTMDATSLTTMITVNNRFRPGLADAAGHMSQHGLCTLDPTGDDFDALVRHARSRLLTAQKNAYYDQRAVDDLIATATRERPGFDFSLVGLFNNRRSEDGPADTAPTPAEIDSAPPATFTWKALPNLHNRLMLHISDAPAAVHINVQIDTTVISRDDATAMLNRLESTVMEAARP